MDDDYQLLDSGQGQKLERFGRYTIVRPCSQAVWKTSLSQQEWDKADALFSRDSGNQWLRSSLPDAWNIQVEGIWFRLSSTDFGHLGIFPEQRGSWQWIGEQAARFPGCRVLNLFAYSGGATLAAALAGARVCHLDASKGMVTWARENSLLNGLENAPIRWIVEDVKKFLERERRRGSRYDGIVLDPPTFGRGPRGELFKIEEEVVPLLEACVELLSDTPRFLLLSGHTPGFSPIVMEHLIAQAVRGKMGTIERGEMLLEGDSATLAVPSGTFARWRAL